jgi:spermidine/putrescine transport system substrate-binding protein
MVATLFASTCSFAWGEHSTQQDGPTEKVLTLLSWPGFFPQNIIRKFEQKHDVRIYQTHFFSDVMRDEMVYSSDQMEPYDVIIASEKSIYDYVDSQSISRLDKEKLPNLRHIDHTLVGSSRVLEHATMISYTTLGLVYHKDKVTESITSWRDFFSLPSRYKGKILFPNDSVDVMDIALLASGIRPSEATQEDLILAARTLQAFVERLSPVTYDGNSDEALIDGDLWIYLGYATEAETILKTENNHISFMYPGKQTRIWRDYVSIHADSKQVALAHQWLDFIMEPSNAIVIAEYNNYPTTNTAAITQLKKKPKSIVHNKLIYLQGNNISIDSSESKQFSIDVKKDYLYHRIFGEKL